MHKYDKSHIPKERRAEEYTPQPYAVHFDMMHYELITLRTEADVVKEFNDYGVSESLGENLLWYFDDKERLPIDYVRTDAGWYKWQVITEED